MADTSNSSPSSTNTGEICEKSFTGGLGPSSELANTESFVSSQTFNIPRIQRWVFYVHIWRDPFLPCETSAHFIIIKDLQIGSQVLHNRLGDFLTSNLTKGLDTWWPKDHSKGSNKVSSKWQIPGLLCYKQSLSFDKWNSCHGHRWGRVCVFVHPGPHPCCPGMGKSPQFTLSGHWMGVGELHRQLKTECPDIPGSTAASQEQNIPNCGTGELFSALLV